MCLVLIINRTNIFGDAIMIKQLIGPKYPIDMFVQSFLVWNKTEKFGIAWSIEGTEQFDFEPRCVDDDSCDKETTFSGRGSGPL